MEDRLEKEVEDLDMNNNIQETEDILERFESPFLLIKSL